MEIELLKEDLQNQKQPQPLSQDNGSQEEIKMYFNSELHLSRLKTEIEKKTLKID